MVAQVKDLDALEAEVELGGLLGDLALVAQQDRIADALACGLNGGADDAAVCAVGVDHSLRGAARCVVERAGELALLTHELLEAQAIGLPVGDRVARHTAGDSGLGHGYGHLGDEARVDRLGNEVIGAEGKVVDSVLAVHDVGHGALGQVGQGVNGGELHLLIYGGGSRVERTAEEVGEAEHIVDLIGIVAAAGGDEAVGTGGAGILVGDLGHRVGQSEDDGLVGHGAHHFLGEDIAARQAYEHVSALDSLGQRVHVGTRGGEELLLRCQVGTVGCDNAVAVQHENILLLGSEGDVELGARDGSCAGSAHHDLYIAYVLAGHLEGIEQSGRRDDGRAVLVVVHHGDVKLLLEPLLYLEALRGLDVLQIDTAEGGRDGLHGLDELFRVLLIDLDVEGIHAAVDLEQQALAFHHRFAGHSSYVAQAEDGGAVAYHGDQVALVGVFVRVVGMFLYLEARLCDARRISQ